MSKIRFYLDEQVDYAVARGLRVRGIDVLTTPDAHNRGLGDEGQLSYARSENRVLVTQDEDFLIYARQSIDHTGIVYYKTQTRSVKQVIRALLALYDETSAEEMIGLVKFL